MAAATITRIGDRLQAINDTIEGVKTRRYWPQNYYVSALHPLLLTLWHNASHVVPASGGQQYSGSRNWELLLILGAWESGIPTESMSRLAETLAETVTDTYICRPRLEFNGEPLDGVERVELQTDTGPIELSINPALACVRWPLIISTRKVFEFNSYDPVP